MIHIYRKEKNELMHWNGQWEMHEWLEQCLRAPNFT